MLSSETQLISYIIAKVNKIKTKNLNWFFLLLRERYINPHRRRKYHKSITQPHNGMFILLHSLPEVFGKDIRNIRVKVKGLMTPPPKVEGDSRNHMNCETLKNLLLQKFDLFSFSDDSCVRWARRIRNETKFIWRCNWKFNNSDQF